MAHRSYRTRDPNTLDVPTFDVGGVTTAGDEWVESFTCERFCPATVLDYIESSILIDDSGQRVYSKLSIVKFLTDVLVEADRDRFAAMLADTTKFVELSLLGEIMVDLTETYTNRPTGPRPASPDGSRETEGGSSGASSSADTAATSSEDSTPPAS